MVATLKTRPAKLKDTEVPARRGRPPIDRSSSVGLLIQDAARRGRPPKALLVDQEPTPPVRRGRPPKGTIPSPRTPLPAIVADSTPSLKKLPPLVVGTPQFEAELASLLGEIHFHWTTRKGVLLSCNRLILQAMHFCRQQLLHADPEFTIAYQLALEKERLLKESGESSPDDSDDDDEEEQDSGKGGRRRALPKALAVKVRALYTAVMDGTPHPLALRAYDQLRALKPAIQVLDQQKRETDLVLTKLVRRLPTHGFVTRTRGLSEVWYGGILAETLSDASDPALGPGGQFGPGNYPNPAKLFKRFGVAVFLGERQRKHKDKEMAAINGYSPKRRSVLWNVQNSLVGVNGLGPKRPFEGEDLDARQALSPYERMFLDEMIHLSTQDTAFFAKTGTSKLHKDGQVRMTYSRHAAVRARRQVGKMFLVQMWRDWHGTMTGTVMPHPTGRHAHLFRDKEMPA